VHRRTGPSMVPRARHPLARLGPVWAILAVSLGAAFMPTSAAAAEIEDQPGKLTLVAGEGPEGQDKCENPPGPIAMRPPVFPAASRFSASKFPTGLALDGTRLYVAAGLPGYIDLEDNSPHPVLPAKTTDTDALDIAVDAAGSAFYGAKGTAKVMKVQPGSPPVRIAGVEGVSTIPNGHAARPEDDRPAAEVPLAGPTSLAVARNKVYVAEKGANGFSGLVREIDLGTTGNPIRTLAGGGTSSPAGAASTAFLAAEGANGLAVAGNSLYIAEGGGSSQTPARILKVDLSTEAISVVSGLSNVIKDPSDVAVDSQGNLYVADRKEHKVFMRKADDGTVERVAGTGVEGPYSASQDWGKTTPLNRPHSIVLDLQDNLYIADSNHCVIRRVKQPRLAPESPVVSTTAPTTAPTTAVTTPTTVPTVNPPGSPASDPTPVGGSSELGGAGSGDPSMGGTTGGFGGFDGGGGFNSNIFETDFFNQFAGFARGDLAAGGVPGVGGDGGGGGGALAGPLPAPTPPVVQPAPPQPAAPPVASGPPLAGQGLSGPQVGLGATTGQLPRGAVRYTMVARADEGLPMAAMALATGAVMLFSCVLVLAAGPGSSGSRSRAARPRPRIAY